MGGFVGGMVAGAVVVLILGAVLSLQTPLTQKPIVATEAPQPEDVAASEVSASVAETGSDADLVDAKPAGPNAAEFQEEDVADLSSLEQGADVQPTITAPGQQPEQPAPGTSDEVAVLTNPPAAPPLPGAAPETPQDEVQPQVIGEAPAAPEGEDVAVLEPSPNTDVLAPSDDSTEENPFENSPIAVEGDEDTLPRTLPRIAALPQIGGEDESSTSTIVGKRVIPLTERDDPPAEVTNDADASGLIAMGKPIETYAASFENAESKPLMSIILIDDEGAFGAEALQDFPYPISFAVSPSDPNAAEKMARHRAAGFEVMALADLPEAASAQDAEVSMAVWLETLPETVGILEGVTTGIQGNRKLADQVAEIAGVTGRGLITQDNGLNTVQKIAARNGIPSSVVFRDIDGARQDPKIMRRFLDQAVFRAGQEGTVVMLGRVRPETISALLLWGLEDRASRVAMAPISAVMKREVQ